MVNTVQCFIAMCAHWSLRYVVALSPNYRTRHHSCTHHQYLHVSANGTVSCSDCSPCKPGYYVTSPCSSTADTVCARCPKGTYSTDGQCTPCRICEHGEYRKRRCRRAVDTQCLTCPEGTFSKRPNSRVCRYCMWCRVNERISKTCTAKIDTKCEKCKDGYFREMASNECVSCDSCHNVTTIKQYEYCLDYSVQRLQVVYQCEPPSTDVPQKSTTTKIIEVDIFTDKPSDIVTDTVLEYDYPHALFVASALTCVVSGFLMAVCVMSIWHYRKLTRQVERAQTSGFISPVETLSTVDNQTSLANPLTELEPSISQEPVLSIFMGKSESTLSDQRSWYGSRYLPNTDGQSRASTLSHAHSLHCCKNWEDSFSSLNFTDTNLSKHSSFYTSRESAFY